MIQQKLYPRDVRGQRHAAVVEHRQHQSQKQQVQASKYTRDHEAHKGAREDTVRTTRQITAMERRVVKCWGGCQIQFLKETDCNL